jgi:hypothetical protein
MSNLFVSNFSSENPDDILNSLETELVQKDIELEMKDIEIQSQRKKIESLLLKVCHLSKKLKIKSNQIANLNQKLKGAGGKAAPDNIRMELRRSKNCLSQKFTEVENIDTILEIKDENQCGMNTEEAQMKQYPVDIAGLTAVNAQPSQTVTRTKEEDIQPREIHIGNILENNNENKEDAGYELCLFKKIATDDRAIRKDKNIECKICSKTLASNRSLRNHVNAVHKKMKPHKCQICAGTFSQMSSLKSHVDSDHNNLRPFECPICSKTITTSRGLRWHVDAVHKKMKPHQCQICAATFSRSGSLKSHVDVVHNQLRPFECKICFKRLATNSDLNRHYGKLHKNLKS